MTSPKTGPASAAGIEPPISRDEFIAIWSPRLAGLMIYGALNRTTDHITPGLIRRLLGRMYRTATEPNYRPSKKYLATYDMLGRLADVFGQMDEENYIPASAFLDHDRFPDFNAIHRALRKNPGIRTNRPRSNRLNIHAADLLRRTMGQVPADPLDLPASVVDAVMQVEQQKTAEMSSKPRVG